MLHSIGWWVFIFIPITQRRLTFDIDDTSTNQHRHMLCDYLYNEYGKKIYNYYSNSYIFHNSIFFWMFICWQKRRIKINEILWLEYHLLYHPFHSISSFFVFYFIWMFDFTSIAHSLTLIHIQTYNEFKSFYF